MKGYTDLEQSKKLAEILPLESADMHYWKRTWRENDYAIGVGHSTEWQEGFEAKGVKYIPCWSLTSLLSVLPEYNLQRTDWGDKTEYKIVVTTDEDNYASKNYDNPLDACYEMIIHLHKLQML